MKKHNVNEIFSNINSYFTEIKCELEYNTPYQLLIAVILSAQCTDKRVNSVTKQLFKVAPTAEKMVELGIENIEKIIHSCGFHKVKAKNIYNCSAKLIHNFNGEVPKTMQELITLDGVGRKTASVVLSECFNIPAFAVDTHVFRVSNRIGLSCSKNVEECEKQLCEIIPASEWKNAHYSLVLFGRYVCKAKGYNCENCKLKSFCKFNLNKGK